MSPSRATRLVRRPSWASRPSITSMSSPRPRRPVRSSIGTVMSPPPACTVSPSSLKAGEDAILGTPLQQIWRDHLLLLSMLQAGDWSDGKYVMVYPRRNVSYRNAARDYRRVLGNSSTFEAFTLEKMLALGPLTPASTDNFTSRNLW